MKYGTAFFRQITKAGMKSAMAANIEWVGPRCEIKGISMSMSGITESMKMRGRLSSVLVSFADALPKMYPSAK
jgi:hydrogenase maturation factor